MRHIPDEELHAYLDQALSRSQAVEIESHLAHCTGCRAARDQAALLRDRTTALLTQLGPGTIPLPPFDQLRRRVASEQHRTRTLLRRGVWVASLALAVGLGWASREFTAAPPAPERATAPAPAPVAIRPSSAAPLNAATPRPRPVSARPRAVPASVQYDTLGREPAASPSGLWHNVSLAGATAAGTPIPRVAGLPVLQIQLQESPESPPVVAVDQRMANGETVRTIEGPAHQVWSLYAASAVPTDTADVATLSLRQGDRMLFMTARVSPDSLRAMVGKLLMH